MPEKILVVEDERNIASFVSMYLKNARYHVEIARDGTEALQKADATKPDLVVLDLMLPDIDGLEVCRQIRSSSDVPILMLTARDDDVDKIVGLEVGRRRLPHQAVQSARARRAHQVDPAPVHRARSESRKRRRWSTASFASTRAGAR